MFYRHLQSMMAQVLQQGYHALDVTLLIGISKYYQLFHVANVNKILHITNVVKKIGC